jgi:hypothetical protein
MHAYTAAWCTLLLCAAAERFTPLLPAMFKSLAEALPSSEQHGVLKLLSSWRKEAILPEAQIAAYEAALPPAAMAEAARGAATSRLAAPGSTAAAAGGPAGSGSAGRTLTPAKRVSFDGTIVSCWSFTSASARDVPSPLC